MPCVMPPKLVQTVFAVNFVQAVYTLSLAAALNNLAYMPDLHTMLPALLQLLATAHTAQPLLGVSHLSHC